MPEKNLQFMLYNCVFYAVLHKQITLKLDKTRGHHFPSSANTQKRGLHVPSCEIKAYIYEGVATRFQGVRDSESRHDSSLILLILQSRFPLNFCKFLLNWLFPSESDWFWVILADFSWFWLILISKFMIFFLRLLRDSEQGCTKIVLSCDPLGNKLDWTSLGRSSCKVHLRKGEWSSVFAIGTNSFHFSYSFFFFKNVTSRSLMIKWNKWRADIPSPSNKLHNYPDTRAVTSRFFAAPHYVAPYRKAIFSPLFG